MSVLRGTRVRRSALFLGVAFATLAGAASADDLNVTVERTTTVTTSSAANGTPGNVTISPSVAVNVSTTGAAVTIDSANTVTNSGVILNRIGTGGTGVHVLSNSAGTLMSVGAVGGIISVRNDSSNPLTAANNIGVLLDGAATFTGSIDLQTGSSILVLGANSTGMSIRSAIAGDFHANSSTNVIGENAKGLSLLASVGGELTMNGGISVRGTNNYTITAIDPFSNSAVIIGASIGKGILVGGPDGVNLPPTSTLFSSGMAPTLLIAPSAAGSVADITVGMLVSDAINPTFSFVNRGTIQASDNDTGVHTTAILVGESGVATRTVNLSGGIYNRGTIVSTSESDNEVSSNATAVNTNATGLIIGNGATVNDFIYNNSSGTGSTVSTIVLDAGASTANDFYKNLIVTVNGEQRLITAYDGTTKTATVGALNGSSATFAAAPSAAGAFTIRRNAALLNDGQIQAAMTGSESGRVTALLIAGPAAGTPLTALNHGTLPSLVNLSTISALATSTDPNVTGLAAFAIDDQSGTLNSVTNTGRIATSISILRDFSQQSVAADLSRSTQAQTFINTGTVTGDIRFGSAGMNGAVAGNQLTIEGVNALVDGSITSAGAGTLDIHVSEGGGSGTLQTVNTRARVLNVGSKGAVNFSLNRTIGIAPLIATTGGATLAADTTMALNPTTFLQDNTAYTLIGGGGTVRLLNPQATTAGLGVPVLFKGTVACDGGPCTQTTPTDFSALTLSLTRKTAAELGLSGNSARIYEPLADAAIADDLFGSSLVGLTDLGQAQAAIAAAVPDIAGGMRALSIAMTDQATGVVASRQRALMTAPPDTRTDLRFWAQEFYSHVSQDSSATSTGFGGAGQGVVLGAEWGSSQSRYGIGYTFFSSQETERQPRDTKTNGDWNLVSAYAGWRFGDAFISPQVSVGSGDFANRRTVPTGTTSLRFTSAQWSSYLAAGGVTAGYIIDIGGFQIIPEIAVDGLWLNQSAYNERGGGGLNLHLKSQAQKSVRTFAGLLGQGSYGYDGGAFVPQLLAGWSHEFMKSPSTIDGTFEAAPGSPFRLVGPTLDADRVVGGASFAYVLRNWSAGVNVDATTSAGAMTQSATVSISSRF